MAGGLIELVAYGVQDLFLTDDPQITFFKKVYRRHTNFSTEHIMQPFNEPKPDFGKRLTCVLSRNGDLIRKVYLVVTLPRIPIFKDEDNEVDTLTKFAWVRRVGYAMIRFVEVEIGGELIDRQYGDWLNIWHELTIQNEKQINEMIGDVDELIKPTNGKEQFKIYVPLQFWFCRFSGTALPAVSLQYSHIKINVELQDFNELYTVSPTHFINIDNDLVNFQPFEFIQQTVDGVTSLARFVSFDVINRRLYLSRITDDSFQSVTETDPLKIQTEEDQDALLYAKDSNGNLVNEKFLIRGLTTRFEAMPRINANERSFTNRSVNLGNISLKNASLLVEYIFLDDEERVRFAQGQHEYLIEQILFNGVKTIDGINQSFKLGFTQPCKELIWVTSLSLAFNERNNDIFNYTDSMIRDEEGNLEGINIIREETLIMNGQDRVDFRSSEYFNWVQIYQNHQNKAVEGINVYSFGVHPEKHQPSGSANLSKIDSILLKVKVNPDINFINTAKLKAYARVNNVLRVANGISGLVFANDVQIGLCACI